MCGNRVEELESRVKELEASVEGLTDELVESKVRIRELESALDEEDVSTDQGNQGETTNGGSAGTSTDLEDLSEAGPADTSKREDANSDDNREESEADSGSDIIVA